MHWSGRRKEIHPCDTCNLFWPGLQGLPLAKRARFAAQAGLYFIRHRPTGKRAPDPVPPRAAEPPPQVVPASALTRRNEESTRA
jgi:hypothetical protein